MKNEDFQKLKKFVEKELKIEESNVMEKSIQLSNLYTKFLQIYTRELKNLKSKHHEKAKTYGELYHHYKFKFDYQLDTKAEVESYIRADDKYYQIALEYSNLEVQVKYLEQILEQINNLGFRIKNYIDLKKISLGF
ncbi:MAG: recombination mediator protein UvsY [Elusimicrobiota bacterium]